MLGAQALRDGRKVSWSDPTELDATSFSVRDFFPALCELEASPHIDHDCMETGCMWVTARPLWKSLGSLGGVRMVPLVRLPPCPVVIHVLTDAPYTTVRNWTWRQGIELAQALEKQHGIEAWVIPPRGSRAELAATAVLCKIASAKIFIGCDSGFSHAYALMNPGRPIVWIGHDMAGYKRRYGDAFDSSPISSHVTRFHLRNHLVDLDAVLKHTSALLANVV
jgi:hypothetical protein